MLCDYFIRYLVDFDLDQMGHWRGWEARVFLRFRAVLYTSTAAFLCNVYKLLCLNRGYIFRWKGAEKYIFRLSAQVCVGDEIYRDFVDLVTTLKCNFSAFCHVMNAKDTRKGEKAGKFVSPKTFRSLFF